MKQILSLLILILALQSCEKNSSAKLESEKPSKRNKYLTESYASSFYEDSYAQKTLKLKNEGLEFYKKKNDKKAIEKYEEALLYYASADLYYHYGNSLMNISEYENAIAAYHLSDYLGFDKFYYSFYNTACAYSKLSDKKKTYEFLEKAILGGYSNFNYLKKDTDLTFVRNQEDWQVQINKLKQIFTNRNKNLVENKKLCFADEEMYTFHSDGSVDWKPIIAVDIKNYKKKGNYRFKNYTIFITWSESSGEKGYGKRFHCSSSACEYEHYKHFENKIHEKKVLSWYKLKTNGWWKVGGKELICD